MRTVDTKLNKTGEAKTSSVFKPTAEESFFKGNQPGFFNGFPVQAKLKVGASDDFYEREADAMADKVMRMPEPTVQRSCSSCSGKKREAELYRKPLAETISRASAKSSGSWNVSPGVESAIRSSAGGGQSLPGTTRSFMESRFGTDFSGVNIHTGSRAQQLNTHLGARAFTYGNDIFFNRGEYNPSSTEGKHLLAHELTHVVQQNNFRGLRHDSIKRQKIIQRQESSKKETGQGFVVLEEGKANLETFRLYNFDIESYELKNGHKEGLINTVMPKIPTDPSSDIRIALIGHASETGNDAYNWKLSRERAMAVYNWMLTQNVSEELFLGEPVTAMGKSAPLEPRTPDNPERPEDRAVRIQIWNTVKGLNKKEQNQPPPSWCNAFMELIHYEDKHGKREVLKHYHSLNDEKLIPLNHNIPSIYGMVDVDWMFRMSHLQYPFILSSTLFPNASEIIGGWNSRGGYLLYKTSWNTLRATSLIFDSDSPYKLEYESVFEEGNWNAHMVIVAYIYQDMSLREIFEPAVRLCSSHE